MTTQPSVPHYKYWAFISFSHQDNQFTRADGKGDYICWAKWLHDRIETFPIPAAYRDRLTPTGEPMPENFCPSFRDEAELTPGNDLGGKIREALERSRFLIVIASPRSAGSDYVNEEVRYFRQLDRTDRILTLIIDGEPKFQGESKPGSSADDKCFCPALVHPLLPDGRVDKNVWLPERPIGADVRMKDNAPPREMRASERDQPDRRDLLEIMKLKLIAGLMGVGLDDLVQREKARQLNVAMEKAKTLRRWLTAVGILAVLALAAAGLAWANKREADRQKVAAVTSAEQAKSAKNLAVAAKSAADELINYMQYDFARHFRHCGPAGHDGGN